MIGLNRVAVVYTPAAADGEYTVVAIAALACRLVLVNVSAEPSETRAAGEALRRLLWGPEVTVPEPAQIEVDGVRWNVRGSSVTPVHGPSGAVAYHRCEVVRADAS